MLDNMGGRLPEPQPRPLDTQYQTPARSARAAQESRRQEVQPKESALFHRSRFRATGPALERIMGLLILVCSYGSSMMAFNGSRAWPLALGAVGAGFVAQSILTWGQWSWTPAYGLRGLSFPRKVVRIIKQLRWNYVFFVLLGAALTVVGLRGLLLDDALRLVIQLGVPPAQQQLAAYGLLSFLGLVIEALPEMILVDD